MSKDSFNTNNHYVPRCYLKSFASRTKKEESYIFAYQRKSSELIEPNIKYIASERGLYEFTNILTGKKIKDIENMFTFLEDEATPVINKLINSENVELTDIEKFSMSNFMAFLYVRNIAFREKQKDLMSNMMKEFISVQAENKDYFRKTTRKAGIHFKSDTEFEDFRNRTIEFDKHFKLKMSNGEDYLLQQAIKIALDIAPYFFGKEWNMLTSSSKTVFVTSDNPVVLLGKKGPYGNGFPNSSILIPLNPNKVLFLTDDKCKNSNINLNERKIILINKYIMYFAYKYTFSNLKSKSIKAMFNNTNAEDSYKSETITFGPYIISTSKKPKFLSLEDIVNN